VEFYTEKEFLDIVVQPTYRDLGIDGSSPFSLGEFQNTPFPQVDCGSDTNKQNLYDRLKKLQANVPYYKTMLNQPRKENVPRELFRQYIAMFDVNGKDIFDWIAVKNVEIHCPFTVSDVGQIALCDTPGLGSFVSDEVKNLAVKIGENIDAALMVKKISQKVDTRDTTLYTLLGYAFPELERKDWSYFILNNDNGSGEPERTEYETELREKRIICGSYPLIDCRQDETVRKEFDTILDGIAVNQQALDDTLYQARFQEVEKLVGEIQTLVEKARGLIKNLVVAGNPGLIVKMFNDCWGDVAVDISNIVEKCKDACGDENNEFTGKLKEIEEQEMNRIVADAKDAGTIKTIKRDGLPQWFADKQRELRIDLSMAFDTLDEGCESLFDKIRQDVVNILKKEGKLATVFDSEMSEESKNDANLWLKMLAEQIGENQNGGKIARSIGMFCKASYSFRGNMLHRVRKTFGVLDSSDTQSEHYSFSPGDTVDDVCDKLQMAYEKAVSECCKELRKLAQEPNNVRYAAIDSFADVCCGAMLLLQNVWERFYEQHAGEVWPETFSKFTDNSKLKQDWDNEIRKLETAAGLLK
jgi:hypothetical protein